MPHQPCFYADRFYACALYWRGVFVQVLNLRSGEFFRALVYSSSLYVVALRDIRKRECYYAIRSAKNWPDRRLSSSLVAAVRSLSVQRIPTLNGRFHTLYLYSLHFTHGLQSTVSSNHKKTQQNLKTFFTGKLAGRSPVGDAGKLYRTNQKHVFSRAFAMRGAAGPKFGSKFDEKVKYLRLFACSYYKDS